MKTKNSKKVLALILSFFMILTVLPFNVMAEGEPGEETPVTTPVPVTEPAKAPEPTDPTPISKEELDAAKATAISKIDAKAKELQAEIDKIKNETLRDGINSDLTDAYNTAEKAINDVPDTSTSAEAKEKIDTAVANFENALVPIKTRINVQKAAEEAEEAAKLTEAKKEAKDAITAEATKATDVINKIADETKKAEQAKALEDAVTAANAAIESATAEDIKAKQEAQVTKIEEIKTAAQKIVNEEKAAEEAKKATQLSFKSYNVYYDAITGKVVDGNNNPVKDALVKVLGRTTYTDKDGNFTFNMTSESGNYYCGYYGYYWKDYPYNSYKLTTNTGSYFGSNGSYARYYFLVDGYGNIVDSVYAAANSSFTLHGESNKVYTVYYSDYGYGYGYGYPYYDKYYNRYYNPTTSWAKDQKLTASKTDYKEASVTLGYVTNNSWLYTTCYEYGYKYYYGYDRVIYPSQLSLSGNGTIVSGKVGVSYLPIYVYRNGVFLGSGNADVNGYFSIGLNSRVSSTSDLTFYAYGKTEATPQKKADHGVIPVKSTVVIGSTKLIKNINGVETDVNMDVAPFIKDGRTMLPLRYIAEALGFKVDWDRATRTVTLTDKEFKVQIPVETNKIIVNGSTYYSDANPVLRNGRTMLPVANIARALGLKDGTDILWDANTRVATITRLVKY